MAKKFMYVCIGILALVATFHLGAASVRSQAEGQIVGIDTWGGADQASSLLGPPDVLVQRVSPSMSVLIR